MRGALLRAFVIEPLAAQLSTLFKGLSTGIEHKLYRGSGSTGEKRPLPHEMRFALWTSPSIIQSILKEGF
jgi:hypothetical protein